MLIINFEGCEAKGLSKSNTTKPSLVKMGDDYVLSFWSVVQNIVARVMRLVHV